MPCVSIICIICILIQVQAALADESNPRQVTATQLENEKFLKKFVKRINNEGETMAAVYDISNALGMWV